MKLSIVTLFIFIPFLGYSQLDLSTLDSIVAYHTDQRFFQGTVLVADSGIPVYERYIGLANREDERKIDSNTKYPIASITKLFTAIVILQLVEEDLLQLERNLKTLLPEYPIKNNKRITPHHLLLHISGLPNQLESSYLKILDPKDILIQSLASPYNRFGNFNYNNLDYLLLGFLIEKITGKKWCEAVRERIIKPLELKNTGFLADGNDPDQLAKTYSLYGTDKLKPDVELRMENFYASGSMYSTAIDLLKLDQALYSEKLLKESSKKRMFTSYPEYQYTGYSVWTYRYPFGETKPLVMERRGGILGANLVLMRLLDTEQSIIIMSNNDQFNPDSFGDADNLREAILRVLAKK